MNTDDAIQGVKNQMHGIHNPGVGGSTPPPATKKINKLEEGVERRSRRLRDCVSYVYPVSGHYLQHDTNRAD